MKKRLLVPLLAGLLSLGVNGTLFWQFEKALTNANPAVRTPFDVIWWWVVTSATVGYGDIVPVTTGGRVVGIATILAGFFIYTTFIAVVVEAVHGYVEKKERGLGQIKSTGHIVVCEYTSVADELLQSLPSIPALADKAVVVVSDLVYTKPDSRCSFVFGVPVNPRVMRRANGHAAQYIFVFSNLRFSDPDMKTLHTAKRARMLNPTATLFVEMENPSHPLLEHIGGKVIAMPSSKLMEAIVRGEKLDPFVFDSEAKAEESGVDSR